VTERPRDGTKGISVTDDVEPFYTPSFVKDFFCLDLAISYDGHDVPLLAIQLTELVDGIFLGLSINHAVGDGAAF